MHQLKRADALASFWGAGIAREQTVFTPAEILAVPRALWGRIRYDAAAGPPGQVLTKAGRELKRDRGLPEPHLWIAQGLAVPVESLVDAEESTSDRGLIDPWPHHSWVNPPFDKLKDWLAYSLTQKTDHLMLVPVRPHRVWWREWADATEIVYLNPVKFEGHDGSFPGPLCLGRRWGGSGYLTEICETLGLGGSIC